MTGPFAFLDNLNVLPKDFSKNIKVLQQNNELLQNGITEEQRKKAYYPRISEALYHNIDPYVYSGQEDSIKQAMRDVFFKPDIPKENKTELQKQKLNMQETSRLDAFRMYLGLPQKYGTFQVSEHKPANSNDDNTTYYKLPTHEKSLKYYFDILLKKTEEAKQGKYDNSKLKPLFVSGISKDKGMISGLDPTTVLGEYKLDLGQDEKGHYLSYYDKWDLDPKLSGKLGAMIGLGTKMIGHPYEIYNRIYYDPKTRKPIT